MAEPDDLFVEEDEAQAVTRMAMEDWAARRGVTLDDTSVAVPAEVLRDRALREHLERGERLRHEALRQVQRENERTRVALEDVAGLTAPRRKALFEAFPDAAALRAARESDLVAVPGIGPALARKIVAALRGS